MKCNRFFRILAVAVVLSLLMVALPATPAAATPLVALGAEKGSIGDAVTIDGGGFRGSTPTGSSGSEKESLVDIYFCSDLLEIGEEISYYDHYYAVVKSTVVVQEDGSFSKSFLVPAVLDGGKSEADVLGGKYYVYVSYSDDVEVVASAEFTVIGITALEPEEGPVGTEVEISGVGFDGDDSITVKYDGSEVDIASGDRRVKSSGLFSCSIEIPESIVGAHTITVSDEGGHSGQAHFGVISQIVLDPASASAGKEVTITGTGFAQNADIFVYFDGGETNIYGDYYAGSSGSFVSTFVLPPDVLSGSYIVEVEDEYGNDAAAELEIGAGLAAEPVTTADSPGHVGDTVTLSGSGFTPDATVSISYETDPIHLTDAETDANGDFEVEVTIPPSTGGEHTIIADDGNGNSKEVTFIMESDAPPTPSLLLPADEDKLEDWTFSWEGVTDDSLPVTYELQIATSGQFGEESIVLYKIAITGSEYSLTNEEKPDSSGDTPYYWRLRAKDAASNTSGWTSGRSFTISGFHMPLWLIIVLIAVGVVGLFILGLWLGRRSNLDEYYY